MSVKAIKLPPTVPRGRSDEQPGRAVNALVVEAVAVCLRADPSLTAALADSLSVWVNGVDQSDAPAGDRASDLRMAHRMFVYARAEVEAEQDYYLAQELDLCIARLAERIETMTAQPGNPPASLPDV
jgi:hypothetical protein